MGSETSNDGVGGRTALLGPGVWLALVVMLVTPLLYLARMACLFARRAARISSTGGGDVDISNSMSTTSAAGAGTGCGVSFCRWRLGDLVECAFDTDGGGDGLFRGDILQMTSIYALCRCQYSTLTRLLPFLRMVNHPESDCDFGDDAEATWIVQCRPACCSGSCPGPWNAYNRARAGVES